MQVKLNPYRVYEDGHSVRFGKHDSDLLDLPILIYSKKKVFPKVAELGLKSFGGKTMSEIFKDYEMSFEKKAVVAEEEIVAYAEASKKKLVNAII